MYGGKTPETLAEVKTGALQLTLLRIAQLGRSLSVVHDAGVIHGDLNLGECGNAAVCAGAPASTTLSTANHCNLLSQSDECCCQPPVPPRTALARFEASAQDPAAVLLLSGRTFFNHLPCR